MPGGRPTLYSEEMLSAAKHYIGSGWEEQGDVMPMVESLAIFLNVARSTIYKWADENEEFSDILDSLMAAQAKQLWNKGLIGDYNSTMAKLALTKHGYTDKTSSEVSGPNGQPVEVDHDIVFKIVDASDD
tara:strand:- start:631 stop:1020 length:390 start_codon:yes stop_codon:yes gene_type:complete